MPITVANTTSSLANAASATTAQAVTITTTCLVLITMSFENGATPGLDGATPMSNSGTGMTWTKVNDTHTVSDIGFCRVAQYAGYGNQNASVTFTHTKANATALYRRMTVSVIEGADTTLATAIPSGNRFIVKNPAVTNVSRAITPAGSGSAIIGATGDWNAGNAFSALAGNTIATAHNAAAYTACFITPTTQPLSSGSAFTWGANCAGGANSYAVLEIVPAPGGSSFIAKRPLIIPQAVQRATNW